MNSGCKHHTAGCSPFQWMLIAFGSSRKAYLKSFLAPYVHLVEQTMQGDARVRVAFLGCYHGAVAAWAVAGRGWAAQPRTGKCFFFSIQVFLFVLTVAAASQQL